jgi:hypothetical protein
MRERARTYRATKATAGVPQSHLGPCDIRPSYMRGGSVAARAKKIPGHTVHPRAARELNDKSSA